MLRLPMKQPTMTFHSKEQVCGEPGEQSPGPCFKNGWLQGREELVRDIKAKALRIADSSKKGSPDVMLDVIHLLTNLKP